MVGAIYHMLRNKLNEPDNSIRIIGVDPSLRNTGYCIGRYNTKVNEVFIVGTIRTKPNKTSPAVLGHLQDGLTLYSSMVDLITKYKPAYVFYEYPIGSKSASAMRSYGFVVMMFAALKIQFKHIQFIGHKVSEIKEYFGGTKDAEKEFITNRAYDLTAAAVGWKLDKKGWPMKNCEHIGDAVATYFTGCHYKGFIDKRLISK